MAEKDNETSSPPVSKVISSIFILGIRVFKKNNKKRGIKVFNQHINENS